MDTKVRFITVCFKKTDSMSDILLLFLNNLLAGNTTDSILSMIVIVKREIKQNK